MPQRFKVYDGAYPHFITNTVSYWLPVSCKQDYFSILVDSLNYCVENKGLAIHAYILMPTHFHAVCSHCDGRLPEVIRDFKGYTSRQIDSKLASDGRELWLRALQKASEGDLGIKLWQDGYHPEEIHSQHFFEQKVRYLHDNPVRAGFVEDACAWKYSSAGLYYAEKDSVVAITPMDW